LNEDEIAEMIQYELDETSNKKAHEYYGKGKDWEDKALGKKLSISNKYQNLRSFKNRSKGLDRAFKKLSGGLDRVNVGGGIKEGFPEEVDEGKINWGMVDALRDSKKETVLVSPKGYKGGGKVTRIPKSEYDPKKHSLAEDRLNELKKSTLASYTKKAALGAAGAMGDMVSAGTKNTDAGRADHTKNAKKFVKRTVGVGKAVDRLSGTYDKVTRGTTNKISTSLREPKKYHAEENVEEARGHNVYWDDQGDEPKKEINKQKTYRDYKDRLVWNASGTKKVSNKKSVSSTAREDDARRSQARDVDAKNGGERLTIVGNIKKDVKKHDTPKSRKFAKALGDPNSEGP